MRNSGALGSIIFWAYFQTNGRRLGEIRKQNVCVLRLELFTLYPRPGKPIWFIFTQLPCHSSRSKVPSPSSHPKRTKQTNTTTQSNNYCQSVPMHIMIEDIESWQFDVISDSIFECFKCRHTRNLTSTHVHKRDMYIKRRL